MNIYLSFLLLCVTELAIGTNNINSRIAGASSIRRTPFGYQASLIVNGQFICGAVLVSPRHLLTAAHKVKFLTEYGTNDLHKEILLDGRKLLIGTRYAIKRVSYHKDFNKSPTTIYNDNIAVITLYKSVPENKFYLLINLPIENSEVDEQTIVIASGYGKQYPFGRLSEHLRQVRLWIEPLSNCQQQLNNTVLTDTQLCTMPGPGVGCCDGDDGGPLVNEDRNVVLGIISITIDCHIGVPTIYTKVSRYISYIAKEMTYDIEDPSTWTDHPEANFA